MCIRLKCGHENSPFLYYGVRGTRIKSRTRFPLIEFLKIFITLDRQVFPLLLSNIDVPPRHERGIKGKLKSFNRREVWVEYP
jgi:hypothetical protein